MYQSKNVLNSMFFFQYLLFLIFFYDGCHNTRNTKIEQLVIVSKRTGNVASTIGINAQILAENANDKKLKKEITIYKNMKLQSGVIIIWAWTNLQIQAASLINNNTKLYVPLGVLRPHVEDDNSNETTVVEVATPSPAKKFQFLYCEQEQYRHEYIAVNKKSQMLWVTWNRTKVGENAILPNLCAAHNGRMLGRRCRLDSSNQKAIWEPSLAGTTIIQCRQGMFCETEAFYHLYLLGKDEFKPHHNNWKRASINQIATLHDICLKTNGLPLARKCLYNPHTQKPEWESVDHYKDYPCLGSTQKSFISQDLNMLLANMSKRSVITDSRQRKQTCSKLIQILEKPKQRLLPADIHLSNEILKGLVSNSQDAALAADVVHITHSLMASEVKVLRISAELNTTNSLLDTFESYMDAIGDKFVTSKQCNSTISSTFLPNSTLDNIGTLSTSAVELLNFLHLGVYAHVSKNISVFFINPNCANISGIAVYTSKLSTTRLRFSAKIINYDSLNDFHYRFIFLNESTNILLSESDMELAAFIPHSLWQHLDMHFKVMGKNPVIVLKVYAHDGLFVESGFVRIRKPFSKVLSISIPGYEETLPDQLPFILRHNYPLNNKGILSSNSGCGYWNYSTWTSSGVQTSLASKDERYQSSLILCHTNHLTQFSYLVGGSFKQNDLTDEILITASHQQALDIISLVGCTLSLMGLMGIWITALMFKSWRSQASNKILLNMCVALTLQMILFLFVNTDDASEALVEQHDYTKCVILGAILQYSTLVLFTWMLLIAFLQFQRYVTVIGIQRPKHYILKSAIIAWGLPLIPTLCVAFIDPMSYIPSTYQLVTDTGICYPSGKSLHFGVVLPITVIVLANFTIFLYVFYSISRTLSQTMQRNEKKLVIKQIRLSILLFFLLGLSWMFGLFAFMRAGIAFSYLFCLTATLQGFVLFIYFVVLDQATRESWLKVLYPKYTKNVEKKATELQSMHTTSTSN